METKLKISSDMLYVKQKQYYFLKKTTLKIKYILLFYKEFTYKRFSNMV